MFAMLMGLKTISPRDLQGLVDQRQVTAFDVNSPQSWAKAHVPGALNVDPLQFEERDLPRDKGSALVFYCSNFMCRKAPNAARRAERMGYTNVQVMSAGISGWVAAGLPTEAD
jgi:rhodanese-related sulfurtransferase